MFQFDSKVKREALNFAVLMNCLRISERKLDPLFDNFKQKYDVSISMDTAIEEYSEFFQINTSLLRREFDNAKKAFEHLEDTDEILARGDHDYPSLLFDTKEAPRYLYIRGKKSLLNEKRAVSIVGSRKASSESCKNTRRLAMGLGRNGITIVSGLAKGIDTSAHESALDYGFNTIAVIGTSLTQYYPIENKSLQKEIEKRGLVVSQFSPATKTQRHFFPLRNATMSGLSLATIIMEAGETSGALIQANYALGQKRLVLIPESAFHNIKITWPEKYEKKGAKRFNSLNDIKSILAENCIYLAKTNSNSNSNMVNSNVLGNIDLDLSDVSTIITNDN